MTYHLKFLNMFARRSTCLEFIKISETKKIGKFIKKKYTFC